MTVGQVGYERYCDCSGGKSLVTGQELPKWEDLKEEIRAAWEAACNAASAFTIGLLALAAQEFVRKVENGEARSVRSYAQFKDALPKT